MEFPEFEVMDRKTKAVHRFISPSILYMLSKREVLRTRPDDWAGGLSETEASFLQDMVCTAGAALMCAQADRPEGMRIPKSVTWDTAMQFAKDYVITYDPAAKDEEGGAVEENPTATPGENS